MAGKRAQGRVGGKTAVITGASSAIGHAIAMELAGEGADLVLCVHHNRQHTEETARAVRSLGQQAHLVEIDITNPVSVETMAETAMSRLGRIDILVNNAGKGGTKASLEELAPECWDEAFASNAKGTFLCSSAVARKMIARGGGTIVNIIGASAHRSFPGNGAFAPSKAAVLAFTRQASLEWARHAIRVNGVSPGPVRDDETGWRELEPQLASMVRQLPIPRPATPREVALAVVYLASEEASFVTGQMILVDGGSTNTWYLYSRGEPDR